MSRDPDLTPLPAWRRRAARARFLWLRGKNRRQSAAQTLRRAGTLALSLAISLAGGTLIAYGMYMIYAPAGFITGGFMAWLLQWSHEKDNGRRG